VQHRKNVEVSRVWRRRLLGLGVRVASALVEMGDLDGAERHIKGLMEERDELDDNIVIRLREAVLYTQLGQLDKAKTSYQGNNSEGSSEVVDSVIEGLRLMAVDEYEGAAVLWNKLYEESEEGAQKDMFLINMAVSLLYLRRLPEIQPSTLKLSSMMDKQLPYKSLTFNLVAMYDLFYLPEEEGSVKLSIRLKLEEMRAELIAVLEKRQS